VFSTKAFSRSVPSRLLHRCLELMSLSAMQWKLPDVAILSDLKGTIVTAEFSLDLVPQHTMCGSVLKCQYQPLLQEDEEDYGTEYLVQPVAQPEEAEGAGDFEPGEGDNEVNDDDEFEDEEEEDDIVEEPVPEPSLVKEKRSREEDEGNTGRPLKR
jgi:hypothetical protein